jgi:hypothetical protein
VEPTYNGLDGSFSFLLTPNHRHLIRMLPRRRSTSSCIRRKSVARSEP